MVEPHVGVELGVEELDELVGVVPLDVGVVLDGLLDVAAPLLAVDVDVEVVVVQLPLGAVWRLVVLVPAAVDNKPARARRFAAAAVLVRVRAGLGELIDRLLTVSISADPGAVAARLTAELTAAAWTVLVEPAGVTAAERWMLWREAERTCAG